MSSNSSLLGRFHLILQPASAWMAILALVLFSLLCLVIHAGTLLRLVFPVGSLAVGIFLYFRYPILYVGFTWWLWFLTPLLARMIDYQSSYDEYRRQLIIASPYLVTLLSGVSFLRYLPREFLRGGLPFVLAFTGVAYSLLIGIARYFGRDMIFFGNGGSSKTIAMGLLSWLPCIFFGFHLFVNWRDYPSYRQNIQRTFCWGVLVMGVYGILQYLVVPQWDRAWFYNTPDIQLASGWPEPLQVRVWSTLHQSFTFGYFMMAALLLLLSSQEFLRIPAAVAGYLAFLLATIRSAWGGWFVGLLTFLPSLKPQLQRRLLVTILIMGLCVYPLATIEPFSEVITTRFQTFSNLKKDGSYHDRAELYAEVLDSTLTEGIGRGLGGIKIVDAGILDLIATLGWFGTIPYMGGILLLLVNLFRFPDIRLDPFMNACRAIIVSTLVALPATNTMILLPGVVFWGFAGMAMAAYKYHLHQRAIRYKTD